MDLTDDGLLISTAHSVQYRGFRTTFQNLRSCMHRARFCAAFVRCACCYVLLLHRRTVSDAGSRLQAFWQSRLYRPRGVHAHLIMRSYFPALPILYRCCIFDTVTRLESSLLYLHRITIMSLLKTPTKQVATPRYLLLITACLQSCLQPCVLIVVLYLQGEHPASRGAAHPFWYRSLVCSGVSNPLNYLLFAMLSPVLLPLRCCHHHHCRLLLSMLTFLFATDYAGPTVTCTSPKQNRQLP